MRKPRKHVPAFKTHSTEIPASAPENLGAYDAVKQSVFTMLHGDDYWHDRMKRVLAAAGFITRRIEQIPTHPVWTMHLTRTTFDLATDNPTAGKYSSKAASKPSATN